MIEATKNANGQYDGYQEYQGYKGAVNSGVAVRSDNFQSSGIDNGTILKLKSVKVFTKAVTDSNGRARVHASGRFEGKPIVSVSLLCDQLDAEGNPIKEIFIPANAFDRISFEWAKDTTSKKFVRGARITGSGAVNLLYASKGDKDLSLAAIFQEQDNHKGIQITDRVVATAPYVDNNALQGKTEVSYDVENPLFTELGTAHVYNAEWVD